MCHGSPGQPRCPGLDTTLFLWEAVLRTAPGWASLLPLPGRLSPLIPSRKSPRIVRAYPKAYSHQLCNCWALGSRWWLQCEPQEGGGSPRTWEVA